MAWLSELCAHSGAVGHRIRFLSDTHSDFCRTVVGAKRRSGARHRKVSDRSQDNGVFFGRSEPRLRGNDGRDRKGGRPEIDAPEIKRAGGRALSLSSRPPAVEVLRLGSRALGWSRRLLRMDRLGFTSWVGCLGACYSASSMGGGGRSLVFRRDSPVSSSR